MSARPWMKFCTSDWRGSTRLKLVSMAARGLWIDMICIMHEAEPYGHLVVDGVPVHTPDKLGALVGASTKDVEIWLAELVAVGVAKVRRNGVIYSSRMESDEIKRSKARDNGRIGGLISQGKITGKPPTLEGWVDLRDQSLRDQSPDSRQKEDAAVARNDDLPQADFDVLGSRIFHACCPKAQERAGGDAYSVIKALKEEVSRGGDPDIITEAMIAFVTSGDQVKMEGQFAASPVKALREGRWTYWVGKTGGMAASRTPSLKVVLKQTIEHEGKIWVSPDGVEATMVGTEKLPGIGRQLSDVREWRKFGAHGWAVDKLGPYPDEPGTRVWPSVLEHFGIVTKGQAA